MKKIGIYKITSPSGKVYIGQAIDIERRWVQYRNLNCKDQTKVFNSLNYYGVNSHTFEIIMECAIEDLNYYERHYQEYYDVLGDYGLNLSYVNVGEKKQLHSDGTRKKISEKLKGNKNSLGTKFDEERKKKLIERNKGNKNWLGKKHSEESRQKMSDVQKGNKNWLGKKHSEDTKIKMSKNNASSKKVINIETGEVYNSVKEAYEPNKEYLKVKYFTFAQKLNGHRTNNTIFRFL
jgi:group I intron endonuclease